MTKAFAKFILHLFGWSVDQNIPSESQRSVMIAAPHTTNWDFLLTRVAFYVLGIPVKIAVKDFWTKFPFGILTVPFGGLGIDRSKKDPKNPRPSQIEQMANFFNQHDKIAMVIAPEGTRSLRKQWKMGFYHTAKLANVPITFGYLDYRKKVAGVGGAIYLSDDIEADMVKIMNFYRNVTPKYPAKYSLDERYDKKINKFKK